MHPDGITQTSVDNFYRSFGPCCAGCDWWRWINSVVGECHRSSPVSADGRAAMLDIHSPSINIGAGQPLTKRSHFCGEFRDTYDWTQGADNG